MTRTRSDLTAVAAILIGAAGGVGATWALMQTVRAEHASPGVECAAHVSARGLVVTAEGKGRVVVVPRASTGGMEASCGGLRVSHAITVTPVPRAQQDHVIRLRVDAERVRREAERVRAQAERARVDAQRVRVDAERQRLEAARQALEATTRRLEAIGREQQADEARRQAYQQAVERYRAQIKALEAALEARGGGSR